MPTYFGQQTQTATDAMTSAPILYVTVATFVCPGSVGVNQNIQELSIYIDRNGVTGSIRLGVYSSDGTTLIAESTSAIALAGTGLTWQGAMTQAAVKAAGGVSPGILVGGTSYRLAFANGAGFDGSPNLGYTTGGTSDNYTLADYSSGMPASIPGGSAAGYRSCVRCGVDPAASPFPGGSVGFRTTVVA